MKRYGHGACTLAIFWCCACFADAPPASSPVAVAGLSPFERPESAPRVIKDDQAETRRKAMLHGVQAPYAGMQFVDSQGAWYTPLARPGMTGRYDLLERHAEGAASTTATAPLAPSR